MYEDDGDTYEYERGASARTKFTCRELENRIEFEIGPASGSYNGMPTERVYNVTVYGTTAPRDVSLDGQSIRAYQDKNQFESADSGWFYEMRGESGFNRALFIRMPAKDITKSTVLELQESQPVRYYH